MENDRSSRENRFSDLLLRPKVRILLILLPLLFLLPVLLSSVYNRPCADDFNYALGTHAAVLQGEGLGGVLRTAWEQMLSTYRGWQGTYVSCFLFALQPGIWGEEYYALTTGLLCLYFLLCQLAFWSMFRRRILRRKEKSLSFLLAWSVGIFFLMGLPSSAQGLFWYNGAVHYMPGVSSLFLLAALLGDALCAVRGRAVLTAAAALLAFLISGGNQVSSFFMLLALIPVTIRAIRQKRSAPLWVFLAGCAGFVLMFAAPGNAARQAMSEGAGVVSTMFYAGYWSVLRTAGWINVPSVCALLLFAPLALELVKLYPQSPLYRRWYLVWLGSFVALCAMFCVPYKGVGNFGDGRLTNVVWIIFQSLLFFDLYCLLGALSSREKLRQSFLTVWRGIKRRCIVWGALICALAALGLSAGGDMDLSAGMLCAKDLAKGHSAQYAREVDAQLALLKAPGEGDVIVKALTVRPDSLFFDTLTEDPLDWRNTSCAAYYGKSSVTAVE